MTGRQSIVAFVISLVSVFIVAHFTDRGKIMTAEISTPYFSGAALIKADNKWQFNLNEVDSIKKITSIKNRTERIYALDHYKFSSVKSNSRTYEINQPGLVYLIAFSQLLFPFLGGIGSLKLLQLFVHLLFSFFIFQMLNGRTKKVIFFFSYLANPFIIYLALFPFYYFWQVIPSFILIIILLNKKLHHTSTLLLSAILFALIYHVRVSTILLSTFTLLFSFYTINIYKRILALALMFCVIYLLNPSYLSKHPGHVMYSSMGAYPNSPVQGFSDNISFENYAHDTGKQINYLSSPSMYDKEVIMGESKWGMAKFIDFGRRHPLILLRNATYNFFESFAFGYFTFSTILTYISAILGFLFFTLLLLRKKYNFILMIMAASLSFNLYLAPVPIYLFGSYIILLFAFLETFISADHPTFIRKPF